MKPGSKLLAVLLLFAALIAVNYLAASLPWRFDATADGLYTLSPGSKAILARIEEPIHLTLYFSQSDASLPIAFKDYAARVAEMLRQYVRASRGRLDLQIVDPQPDSPAEETAIDAGLTGQPLGNGDKVYFGLVAIQADQQKVIPFLDPNREPFLEYDLSQLLYQVQQIDRPKVGLITSLPLLGGGYSSPGQPAVPAQMAAEEWRKTYNLVSVDASATQLPADLDALLVIHPENLAPQLQFAIDQFLLAGQPVFLAVDPYSQYFAGSGGQMAMMGEAPPNLSSDLPALLSGWGIAFDPQRIVGDPENATQVQDNAGTTATYPDWLSLTRADFNAGVLPTSQLNSMLLADAGSLALAPKTTGLTFTPLIQSSAQSGLVPASLLSFGGSPDAVARQLVPSGRQTLAALIRGTFHTAFPKGPPAVAGADAAQTKTAAPPADFLKVSKVPGTLIMIADTDWLLDDYSVRRFNVLGTEAAQPLNDNLAFAGNVLDYLAGSPDLISLRGKGVSLRQFAVVRRMQAAAQQKYQQQLAALQTRLDDVQTRLSELQDKPAAGQQLIASPAVQQSIADFQKQLADLRTQRRAISRSLREGIESLGNRLLLLNLLAVPLLIGLFGLGFYLKRRRR